MRQSLYTYLNNPYIYTFEASFFGSIRNNEKKDFSIIDYKNLGFALCRSLVKLSHKNDY